jgi:leucyl aminopeptidase
MVVNAVKNVKANDVQVFLIEGTSLELLEKHLKDFKSLKKTIEKTMEVEKFKGKKGESVKLIDPLIYIYSLGEKEKITEDTYREVSAKVSAKLKKDKISKAVLIADTKYSKGITEGLLLGSYDFDKYRTKDKEEKFEIEAINILDGNQKDIELGSIIADAQIFSRNLVNEPGCVINPITLADIAKKECEKVGLKVYVYDEKWIQEQGMNGLWLVGKG